MRSVLVCLMLLISLVAGAARASYAFEPTISIRIEAPPQPIVYGVTNLPDGTELLVTITRPESRYMAQDKVTVRSGTFKSVRFSQLGSDLNPGSYSVSLTMSLAELQAAPVRDVIGSKGEKMSGKLVKTGRFGPTLEYNSTFSIGAKADAKLDAKARERAAEELQQWRVRSCNESVDLVNAMIRSGAAKGKEASGAERQKKVDQCIRELSS